MSYPKNVRFKETSIEVAAGTVTMCDEFRTDDLDVSVAAGEFTNTGKIRAASDTTIAVGTGNVELSELDINNLEVDCGIGNVDLGILGKEMQTTIYRFPVRREMWILATALTAVSDLIRISRTQMPKEI